MRWSRSALWLGQPHPGQAQALATIIHRDLVPAMRHFPGIEHSLFLWSRDCERDVPQIYFHSILTFSSREALDRLQDAPERLVLRPAVLSALALFDGTITHINSEHA